ncbi:hypothetical protein CHI07_17020 [Paenibacillus sp. 7884-2]|nr:hypothetical protein CHI07_17020 [Paenibacillus sp. 7884-2]
MKNDNGNRNHSSRGGKRKGAGRKGLGITKKVSLTLTEEVWEKIEQECKRGKKQSQVLRDLIKKGLGG